MENVGIMFYLAILAILLVSFDAVYLYFKRKQEETEKEYLGLLQHSASEEAFQKWLKDQERREKFERECV